MAETGNQTVPPTNASMTGAASVDDKDKIIPEPIRELLPATLSRLTAGLPLHELDIIIKEAKACEDALEKEIEILERELGINNTKQTRSDDGDRHDKDEQPSPNKSPLKEPTMIAIPLLPLPYQPGGEPGKGHINYLDSVDAMLQTEFAPPDRYFTVSALLGRLRDPMKLPYPPNSRLALNAKNTHTKGKKAESPEQEEKRKKAALEKQRALLVLDSNEMYHREQTDTVALLALYKKISSHRTAAVFRKPVNPAEAPGYKERILFPMDLSLVRKMIVARMIKSFSSLHQRVGLICHNCVKFNGRESDYAVLTRDFEEHVDDKVLEAVKNATAAAAAASAAVNSGAVPAAPSGK
mmetsp:Transcript_4968/g.9233  ORF Transcript_4968/g.9233 Transcript_4968/m.9233 type:complete len:353 (+) Transcript_4968:88-1146(+)